LRLPTCSKSMTRKLKWCTCPESQYKCLEILLGFLFTSITSVSNSDQKVPSMAVCLFGSYPSKGSRKSQMCDLEASNHRSHAWKTQDACIRLALTSSKRCHRRRRNIR
jgi:hypothetical protein